MNAYRSSSRRGDGGENPGTWNQTNAATYHGSSVTRFRQIWSHTFGLPSRDLSTAQRIPSSGGRTPIPALQWAVRWTEHRTLMDIKEDVDANAKEDLLVRDRIRYQWMLESVAKFRFFFAGLVFAMLSFSVQFAVQTTDRAARWCQVLA